MSNKCPEMTSTHQGGKYSYHVDYTGIDMPTMERVRLLLDYRNASRYDCLTNKTGLYVESSDHIKYSEYIQWDTSFRPPMAEPASEYTNWTDESFNTEIVVYLDTAALADNPTATISLGAYIEGISIPLTIPSTTIADDCMLSGESFIPPSSRKCSRVNVLAEYLDSSCDISSIEYKAGTVTVTTLTPHGFSDGDAITISGVEHCAHAQGVDGERYNGIYYVTGCSEYKFKYNTLFDGTDYTPRRVYTSETTAPTASKWVVREWTSVAENVPMISTDTVRFIWDRTEDTTPYNNRLIIGDTYAIVSGESSYPMTVTDVDGEYITATVSEKPDIGTSITLRMAARVPSSDVPVNYSATSVSNIPAYSHISSTTYIGVYDDTAVTDDRNGLASISSSTLLVNLDSIAVLKFTPGYRAAGANTMEITFHIAENTYPTCQLALYEMSSSDWDATITKAQVEDLIIYDVLDKATIDNPGITGGTAVRFMVSGDIVEKWYAAGVPVSLAVRVLSENDIDHIKLCSTEGYYPITAVAGSGKQAIMNPTLFDITVKPTIPVAGSDISIYAHGTGEFSGVPGGDKVMVGDTACDVVSTSSSMIIATLPDGLSGTREITVYRVSGNHTVQSSNPVELTISDEHVTDVTLGTRIRPGVGDRVVSRTATYSKDLSFNGFHEVTDGNNLIQNVYNCLLTNKGERLFNQNFGADLESRIFSLYSTGSLDTIIDNCIEAIGEYERRVAVVRSKCYVTESDGGNGVNVVLTLAIPGKGTQKLVLPFAFRGRMV